MKNYGAVEEGVPPEFTNCFTFSVKIISRFKTRLKHAYPYVNVSSEFLNLHVSHAAGVLVVVVGGGGGGGLHSFISQIGMCLPQGYGFWAFLV